MMAAGRPLLFGLRLWASVSLSLYVAFWLELDNAYWAGASAAVVCQPHLGASLRKVAAYSAALAGYTAAIIASDQLGATGGPNGDAFMLAITRASEIGIGIVCAGIILAGTDLGGARRRLGSLFAAVSAEVVDGFGSTLTQAGSTPPDAQQPVRRELMRKVIALDPVVDEAVGESSTLRYHSPVLQGALEGLLAALRAWRIVGVRLTQLPDRVAREQADAVLRNIPQQLRSAARLGGPAPWMADPESMRGLCGAGARTLIAMPAGTPSLRLLTDQTARVLTGLMRALDALALLTGKADPSDAGRRARLHVADWWPAFVNAGRAFVMIGAAALFWIVTAWPNGALAITFTTIVVTLLAPRADEAYAVALGFSVGVGLGTVGAAIVGFAALPTVQTFLGFSIMIGLYLIPVGAGVAQPWQTAVFIGMTYNFIPLLAPANQMTYDTVQFYNSALAIGAGSAAGALSFRLLPPLSPAFRTRRLLALTLRDLRRLATDPARWTRADWEGRMLSRIAALPDAADPLQRSQIMTALSVGSEIINLRRIAPQLGLGAELDAALAALARGHSAAATARFAGLDRRLAALAESGPQAFLVLRTRAMVLLVRDALVQHGAYFDAGEGA